MMTQGENGNFLANLKPDTNQFSLQNGTTFNSPENFPL